MQLGTTKTIKHSEGVVTYFHSHLSLNLSHWKEGSHDSYLWLRVSRGVAPNLFVCVVYIAPVGSKHESKSLFQNLVVDIVEVQILRGTILLGGDFNAHTTAQPNTIDTSLIASLGNLLVIDSIGHLGANGLVNLLQQCMGVAAKSTFSNKPSRGSCKERHCHKLWFDVDCYTMKCELRLWLKTNPNLHVATHQESKFKNLLKRKFFLWEIARAQHMCALVKVDALSF
jgi:hypothetical protein